MAKTHVINFSASFVKGINANQILVEGSIVLNTTIVVGELNLLAANIGGTLSCTAAKFYNRGDVSFSGDSMIVKGNAFLTNCKSIGKFHIVGSDIGGSLLCDRAKFINIRGDSFSGDSLIAKKGVFLRSIISVGIFRIVGAGIGGDLDCTGAVFFNKENAAFLGDCVTVNGSIFLNEVESSGESRFPGAKVNSDIYFENAEFTNEGRTALRFTQAKIDGRLCLEEIKRLVGILNLRGSKVGALWDDEKSWPDKGNLQLDGFEYDSIVEDSPRDAKSRLRWLDLQIPVKKKSKKTEEPDKKPEETYEYKFSPQPYEHLARLFRKMGKRADANTILLKKERLRRKYVVNNWFAKFWGYLLDGAIGYGYRVGRALSIVAAFIILGAVIFGISHRKDDISSVVDKRENAALPEFNSVFYSIDTFVPFLDLHQEKYWQPYSNTGFGMFATYYFWIHIIMGWVFTTLLAANLAGLIRRE